MSSLVDFFGPRVYVISDTLFKEYEDQVKKEKVANYDKEIQYYEDVIEKLKKKRAELV